MALRFLRILGKGWGFRFALIVLVTCCSCDKQNKATSEEKAVAAAKPSDPVRPTLAIHWIGKTRFMQETNAVYQAEIWNMPESKALELQTLDKSARALSKTFSGGDTNVFASAIRPLLDDILQAEMYFELRAASNHLSEIALAVRLPTNRIAIWQTNLALLTPAVTNGFRLNSQVVGDWTVLGMSKGSNSLFGDFLHRFGGSSPTKGTNWIEVDADLAYLFRSNSWLPADKLPYLQLTATGDGRNVRTRVEVTFVAPIPLILEPWNIPTNWIHDPLVSFTAIRGIRSWIEASQPWKDLNMGAAPNQAVFWALDGLPARTYFVANWPDSSNRFYSVSERIAQAVNRSIETQLWGAFSRLNGTNGIVQAGPPFFRPVLLHEKDGNDERVIGGFSDLAKEGRSFPPELLAQLVSQTNLFFYDWELTGSRVYADLHLSQTARTIFGKTQVSPSSTGAKWLQMIAAKLGNSVSAGHVVMDDRSVTLTRTSSIGLTGVELNLLVDWLESPVFPRGLHTSRATTGRELMPNRSPSAIPPPFKLPSPESQ